LIQDNSLVLNKAKLVALAPKTHNRAPTAIGRAGRQAWHTTGGIGPLAEYRHVAPAGTVVPRQLLDF
jgi:hypothetical protein